MRYLEILPHNGSHYLLMNGQEISHHDSIAIAEAVRWEILQQFFSLGSADSGYEPQPETKNGTARLHSAAAPLANHDNADIIAKY
jgi:hypothetical protein